MRPENKALLDLQDLQDEQASLVQVVIVENRALKESLDQLVHQDLEDHLVQQERLVKVVVPESQACLDLQDQEVREDQAVSLVSLGLKDRVVPLGYEDHLELLGCLGTVVILVPLVPLDLLDSLGDKVSEEKGEDQVGKET